MARATLRRAPASAILPDKRAMLAIGLILVVYAIGWRIPLPGLDFEGSLGGSLGYGDIAARVSLFALGVIPLYAVLAYTELATLAFPPLARWRAAKPDNDRSFSTSVLVLSLLLAAWQGAGIMAGLEAASYARQDAIGFVTVGTACFVGSAALLFWLAGRVDFPGLGGGFWLLLGVPYAIDFPSQLSPLLDLVRTGATAPAEAVVVFATILAAVVLVAFANLLLGQNGRASDAERTSFLLWPPLLAGVVAQYAFYVIPADIPGWPYMSVPYSQVANIALSAILIPIIALLYVRRLPRVRPNQARVWSTPVVLIVIAIQLLLCAVAPLVSSIRGLPVQPIGADLMIAVTVLFALARTSDLAHSRVTRRR